MDSDGAGRAAHALPSTSAPAGRYRFLVCAEVAPGEAVALVGSIPALGSWDVGRALRLRTGRGMYPLWCSSEKVPVSERLEYSYVKIKADSGALVCWEGEGRPRRWVPAEEGDVTVDDGTFGEVQPCPRGWRDGEEACVPLPYPLPEPSPGALKIVVIGSSVAAGHACWLHRGWAYLLAEALRPAGHVVLNVSEPGADTARTAARFPSEVAPLRPDVVIVGLSLGNEGLAHCTPGERPHVASAFDAGIARLVSMVRNIGARPVLGGVYPHGDYGPEHVPFLLRSHAAMVRLGVPVLDWLPALHDGSGRWKPGLWFDAAHPNGAGHEAMFRAVDLGIFAAAAAAAGPRAPAIELASL
eukprot:tig00000455_g1023.t1